MNTSVCVCRWEMGNGYTSTYFFIDLNNFISINLNTYICVDFIYSVCVLDGLKIDLLQIFTKLIFLWFYRVLWSNPSQPFQSIDFIYLIQPVPTISIYSFHLSDATRPSHFNLQFLVIWFNPSQPFQSIVYIYLIQPTPAISICSFHLSDSTRSSHFNL